MHLVKQKTINFVNKSTSGPNLRIALDTIQSVVAKATENSGNLGDGSQGAPTHSEGGIASDLKFCHQHNLWWQIFVTAVGRNVRRSVGVTPQKCLRDKNDA